MRIAIVCSEFPPHAGGIGYYVNRLSIGLAERGHEVHVLTRRVSRSLNHSYLGDNIEVTRFGFTPVFPVGNLIIARRSEELLIRSTRKFDLVNVHCPAPMLIHTKLPAVLTIHNVLGANTEELKRGGGIPSSARLARPLLSLFERLCLQEYSVRTAVSRTVAEQVCSKYGIIRDSIQVIGNGVDLRRFFPSGNEDRDKYILYTGRLHQSKRVDILIRAFAILCRVLPDIRLKIAGNGPQEKALRSLADKEGIGNRVDFLGWLSGEAYDSIVRNAWVYVLPSPYEGMSSTILEAMASRVAVIAARIPNNTEIIEDGRNGLLFRVGDYVDLERRIEMLIADSSLKKRIESCAWKHCAEKHDWRMVTERFEMIMDSTVNS